MFGAMPPVRLGLSERNSGKIPERPRKRSQSVSCNSPREYGWGPPNPVIQGISGYQSISSILSPQYGWERLFLQKWFRRGPLRAGHGIPSSTEVISTRVEIRNQTGVKAEAPLSLPNYPEAVGMQVLNFDLSRAASLTCCLLLMYSRCRKAERRRVCTSTAHKRHPAHP